MIKTYCDRCGKDLTPKPKSPLVAFVESVAKDLKGFTFSFKVDPAPEYVVKRADDAVDMPKWVSWLMEEGETYGKED